MKNKKVLLTVVFAAVCAVVILAVLLVGYHKKKNNPDLYMEPGTVRTFDTLEEAIEWAGFSMKCSDRLSGILVTDYSADKTAITVTYGIAGYVRKTLLTEDADEGETAATNTDAADSLYDIDGRNVFFAGEESGVTTAQWTDNGFVYVISLTGSGVTADVMTDYVRATR